MCYTQGNLLHDANNPHPQDRRQKIAFIRYGLSLNDNFKSKPLSCRRDSFILQLMLLYKQLVSHIARYLYCQRHQTLLSTHTVMALSDNFKNDIAVVPVMNCSQCNACSFF
jgi:hypothetical protein